MDIIVSGGYMSVSGGYMSGYYCVRGVYEWILLCPGGI